MRTGTRLAEVAAGSGVARRLARRRLLLVAGAAAVTSAP
jgi:hypothetical protein